MSKSNQLATRVIERAIYSIRGHRVMLDADLAKLYRVTTSNLNLAVRRNAKRFPADFMFPAQCREGEISKIANCNLRRNWRGRQTRPRTLQ